MPRKTHHYTRAERKAISERQKAYWRAKRSGNAAHAADLAGIAQHLKHTTNDAQRLEFIVTLKGNAATDLLASVLNHPAVNTLVIAKSDTAK